MESKEGFIRKKLFGGKKRYFKNRNEVLIKRGISAMDKSSGSTQPGTDESPVCFRVVWYFAMPKGMPLQRYDHIKG